ncbi:hypothetical protein CAPTEDRAFT_219331 [Capitella teleta]|uniref:Uncharacterized protein n=1 Tax=Capitella teleta TaxID=283909 RepID=R7UAQ5_CAPTE|nr:hypothetical protein CAPTEDRAFT_219331 [Capitella teleta]|eukprot:ELU03059.1 hypothetical protein CAPTEDRAFT_219331 [Capitella teleta]
MELGCGASFAKCLMIIINVIFWLSGVALLSVGLWLLLDDNPFKFLDGVGVVNPMDDPLWSVAIYILIAVGALVFLLGFLGCCGACTNNQCMLFTYIVLVSIVLVVEIVGGIMLVVFKNKIDDSIQMEMKEGLLTRYMGEDSQDGDSVSWNSMQTQLKCCGAYDFTDYKQSSWYNNTNPPKKAVPYTCCVLKSTNMNSTEVVDLQQCLDDAEAMNFDSKYLHTEGCYQSMKSWLDSNAIIIIAVAFAIVFVQIAGLIIACCLRSAISDSYRAEMQATEIVHSSVHSIQVRGCQPRRATQRKYKDLIPVKHRLSIQQERSRKSLLSSKQASMDHYNRHAKERDELQELQRVWFKKEPTANWKPATVIERPSDSPRAYMFKMMQALVFNEQVSM